MNTLTLPIYPKTRPQISLFLRTFSFSYSECHFLIDRNIVRYKFFPSSKSGNLCLKMIPKPRIKELPGIAPRAFTGLYEIIEQNKSKFDTKESGTYL